MKENTKKILVWLIVAAMVLPIALSVINAIIR